MSANFVEKVIRRIPLIGFDFGGFFTDKTVIVLEKKTEAESCSCGEGFGL